MVLFQMTMPVTLTAVWRVFPGEAGLSFGFAALAVLVGVIPVYVCPAEWITPHPLLFALTLVSIAAVLISLPPLVRRDRAANLSVINGTKTRKPVMCPSRGFPGFRVARNWRGSRPCYA